MNLIARRQFLPGYILIDCLFLLIFASLLLYKKKYMTFIVGIVFGVVYFLVDYGIFHLLLHTRAISSGSSLFLVLLWMSLSYGFTNFALIWLWIRADKDLVSWTLLILTWWFCAPLISQTLFSGQSPIVIERTTGAYHGYMALILFIGYLAAVIYNLTRKRREEKIPLLWILSIGVLVQFGWEAGLLLGGIRSAGLPFLVKLKTLLVNSLLETNLGMPYIYMIYLFVSRYKDERMRRIEPPLSFSQSASKAQKRILTFLKINQD